MGWLKNLFSKQPDPAREEPSPELLALLDQSREHLGALIRGHEGGWRFGEHANWNLSQDDGILRFTFADGMIAEAPAQAIGSYSRADKSWMWAWDNPSIDPALKKDSERVRQYGREHAIGRLTTSRWKTDEQWAWSMTALAVKLCDSQGAFCGAMGPMLVFLSFGEVKLSKAGE